MEPILLPLGSPEATIATVGGKGANLSRLTRAAFPVPAGFLVGTVAYRAFVAANDLQQRVVALAQGVASSGAESASAEIRRLFDRGSMPPEISAAIRQAYRLLCPNGATSAGLAVRSSATAEDLPGASFAGQQESFLNVQTEQEVLQAVKTCWSSLWTPRALAYRARAGIDPATVSIAVVLQIMVPASGAGVMFTANPLTGARDETVIDAVWGLGEALVGGLVTPDHITADKETGRIKEAAVSDKVTMTVRALSGTKIRPVEADQRRIPVLNAEQVAQLARMGREIESCLASPQDIEWCLADNQFWIVQSRPITALPSEPEPWESPVPGAKWLKDLQAAEWASEPPSPLGAATTFAAMIAARQRKLPMQKAPWSALINGWLYIRADFKYGWLASRPAAWVLGTATGSLNGHRRVRRLWPQELATLDSLEKTMPTELADEELRAPAGRLLRAVGSWWWEISWFTAAAISGEQFIDRVKVPGLADSGRLFRANDSLLLEAERVLRRAAQTGNVGDYLARFGHFVESADPMHPTLRESPGLLAQHLTIIDQAVTGPDARLERARRERADAEHLVRSMRGVRGFLARRLLTLGQSHAAHVDDAVFHFQRVLALLRATFLEAGRRLATAGSLERAEDVFFLKPDEIWGPTGPAVNLLKHAQLSAAWSVSAGSGWCRLRSFHRSPSPFGPQIRCGGSWRQSPDRRHWPAGSSTVTGDASSWASRAAPVVRVASRASLPGPATSTTFSPVTCS
ncbi:PEP/pyruvate-binding domain-containing protein [Arthrobacter sp. CC3]|uniref:PEP/pyruvate-binding domain-containing protein n=1 Tax=Arthrobacter sp. CC3 TaxID=3029185 RepID=UPI00326606A1